MILGPRYDKGPLGALIDEYANALADYIEVFCDVYPTNYDDVLFPETTDEKCKSLRSIAKHTLSCGYSYANAIRRAFGMEITSPRDFDPPQEDYIKAMDAMFAYTEASLEGHWGMTDTEVTTMPVPISWSDRYDLESILEHAIVHLMRHRRQLDRLPMILPPSPTPDKPMRSR